MTAQTPFANALPIAFQLKGTTPAFEDALREAIRKATRKIPQGESRNPTGTVTPIIAARRARMVDFLRKNPGTLTSDLARDFKIAKRLVVYDLHKLREAGLVESKVIVGRYSRHYAAGDMPKTKMKGPK